MLFGRQVLQKFEVVKLAAFAKFNASDSNKKYVQLVTKLFSGNKKAAHCLQIIH